MDLKSRIDAFTRLGMTLHDYVSNPDDQAHSVITDAIRKAEKENPWFTRPFMISMIASIGRMLKRDHLEQWLAGYHFKETGSKRKRIGVIMAGNIPLVGFHDMLCVLLSGHILVAKVSSKDRVLIPFLADLLMQYEPLFKDRILITRNEIQDIDAVIATGSDNTSRYFEYYFGKSPNIIRKNRNSLAILTGEESDEDIQLLADDIFLYFGLGCRNISKIMLPAGYDPAILKKGFQDYQYLLDHSKYHNNYTYQKSILLMHNKEFHDFGFILLKQEASLSSPVAILHFDYYDSESQLVSIIEKEERNIQCIASRGSFPFPTVQLGETQFPKVWEFSDNIDTFAFLIQI